MLVTGIKSRPIYTTLKPDIGGRQHVLVGQGMGGEALVRVLQGHPRQGAEVVVIYAGEQFRAILTGLGPPVLRLHPKEPETVADLNRTLAECFMGTRVYIAGSESFIGSCVQVTSRYGLNNDEVQCEHVGSAARRVYCIHCKASNENVTTNIVRCTGCGRHLLVRDHYSRRLAGFMGVMVDAEAPETFRRSRRCSRESPRRHHSGCRDGRRVGHAVDQAVHVSLPRRQRPARVFWRLAYRRCHAVRRSNP